MEIHSQDVVSTYYWLPYATLLWGMYTTLYNVHKSTSYFCSTAARRPWRRLQDVVPNVLHAIRHAPISCPVLHSAARRCILHSFYPLLWDESQQLSFHMRSNDTETQKWQTHWLKHRFSFPPAFLLPHSPLLLSPHPHPHREDVQQFQIRFSHQLLPVKKKKKKRRKKSNENYDFSLFLSGTCRTQSTSTFHLISFSI